MSYWDRHWWPRAAGALFSIALAAVFAAWFSTRLLPLDLRRGTPAIISDVLLAADIVGVLLGTAIYGVIKIVLASRRQMFINAAVNGDQDALPTAKVARAYSVARDDFEDVVAAWPHPRWSVAASLFAFLFTGALAAFFGAWLLFIFLEAFHAPAPVWLIAFIRWSHPTQTQKQAVAGPGPSPVGALLSATLFFGSMSLTALVSSLASLRGALSQPARLVANDQGIACQSIWGRRRVVRWQEARLLEVATVPTAQDVPSRWLCTLYTWTSAIQWPQPADSTLGLAGDLFVRVTLRVIVRTGLQPRTLDPKLLAPGEVIPTTFLDRIQRRFIAVLFMGAMGTAMLAFGEVGPSLLTGIGIFAIVGALLTLANKWPFQTSKSPGQRAAPPRQRRSQTQRLISARQTIQSRTFSAEAAFEMTVGSYIAFKFNQIMFVVLGLAAALFGASMLCLEFAQYVLHVGGLNLPPMTPGWILGLAGALVGGVATSVVSACAKDTIVLADPHGIRKRWLLGNTFIPWSRVERMELRLLAGQPWYYRVVGNQGRATISWPISPFYPSLKPQEPGAVLLTPEEMAALAEQRTGRMIQRR